VTRKQEFQSACIIQQGTELHCIKADFDSTHGRDITRTEWTELAKLKSPMQLRKLVGAYHSAQMYLQKSSMPVVRERRSVVIRLHRKSYRP